MNDIVADPAEPVIDPAVVIEDWRTNLPDDVQTWEEVKNSEDPGAFYKQMGDMRSMIGRSVQIPGPEASTEARQAYLQKVMEKTPEIMLRPNGENMAEMYVALGRPETADKYTAPESTEEIPVDAASVNVFSSLALEAGLNQAQFDIIVNGMSKNQATAMSEALSQRGEGLQALRGEWGLAFDQRQATAQKFANDFFPHIGEISKLGAVEITALYNAGKAMSGEGAPITDEPGDAVSAMTPQEAQSTINEIMANKDHAYWNPRHPGHKAAIDKVVKLHEFKNGATG